MKDWIDKLNPLSALQERMVGAAVRWAVTTTCTYLVSSGYVKPEESTQFITTLVGILAPLAWSAWQKYQDKLKFDAARALPAHASSTAIQATANTDAIKDKAWK